MAPGPTRSVTLPATSTLAATHSTARMRLLTYRMALAQPTATLPLLEGTATPNIADAYSNMHRCTPDANALVSRRWVREADELCVASIRRSNNVNRINTYVATYKFDHPQWRPFLLPEVHVLPRPREREAHTAVPASQLTVTQTAATSDKGGSGSGGSGADGQGEYDVFINYNKLVNLELIGRHANYALRHLVQKGHAMYFVNFAQHSILHMRGLVESSYVTCAYGVRGERLRTYLTHIGPLDVRDVLDVDPVTRRVSFDLAKSGVRKGVVALSQVEGYGTWFQRKPMLWQRTRRIGALQSHMGAYHYELAAPTTVGCVRDYEVALLEPHIRVFHAATGGGAEALGIIAASQIAQNERLYVGQFEAPVITAVDAVQQLAHRAALHHKLLRPCSPTKIDAADELGELRGALGMERLLPVSWVTRTPPPYVPLEADLPFKLQLSKATVFAGTGSAPHVFPTGGTVGSPYVEHVPLTFFEYNLHQGVDHYVFDDAPSARPMKWWNQKSNMPYNGYMYFMRSGLLDSVRPAEQVANPLSTTRSSSRVRRHKDRRARAAHDHSVTTTADDAAATRPDLPSDDADAGQACDTLVDEPQTARPAVHALVPPTAAVRRRGALYRRAARLRHGAVDVDASASATATVLRKAIALRRARSARATATKKTDKT